MAIIAYLVIGLLLYGLATELIIKDDPDTEKEIGSWPWIAAMVIFAFVWPISVAKALIIVIRRRM